MSYLNAIQMNSEIKPIIPVDIQKDIPKLDLILEAKNDILMFNLEIFYDAHNSFLFDYKDRGFNINLNSLFKHIIKNMHLEPIILLDDDSEIENEEIEQELF
jgi:hypothetical protein